MRGKIRKVAMAITLVVAVSACSGDRTGRSLPRPVAYPRPALPDTAMVVAPATPLRWLVNREAVASSSREGWLDVTYPSLGATVHVTFTPCSGDVAAVKDNRMERLLLNAGDNPVDFREWTNADRFDIVEASAEGATTPLQFIATDNAAWVVSGAVYFSSPQAAAAVDSIRPMVKAIERDVRRALTELARP